MLKDKVEETAGKRKFFLEWQSPPFRISYRKYSINPFPFCLLIIAAVYYMDFHVQLDLLPLFLRRGS